MEFKMNVGTRMRDVAMKINVVKDLLANGNMGGKSVLRVSMTCIDMLI